MSIVSHKCDHDIFEILLLHDHGSHEDMRLQWSILNVNRSDIISQERELIVTCHSWV